MIIHKIEEYIKNRICTVECPYWDKYQIKQTKKDSQTITHHRNMCLKPYISKLAMHALDNKYLFSDITNIKLI